MDKFDFENSIGFIINRTAKALVHILIKNYGNKFGITFGQWKIIIILKNNDDGLSQKEITDN